ncbi:hypothetical protein [Bacillus cereus]|uniref:hypothetical protein n=1 Tax=Bacillus cereus TaxID=1396 RepID=UPI000BF96521|nr:hypothetical protein [Bacillus cereus]PER69601.1 hypothetical protein CN502_09805 [Bacillus cereus]PGL36032.1 hypothetical protein CN913_20530 [Bacillus cereus]
MKGHSHTKFDRYRRRIGILQGASGLLKKEVSKSIGGVLAQTARYEIFEELRSQYKVTLLVVIA